MKNLVEKSEPLPRGTNGRQTLSSTTEADNALGRSLKPTGIIPTWDCDESPTQEEDRLVYGLFFYSWSWLCSTWPIINRLKSRSSATIRWGAPLTRADLTFAFCTGPLWLKIGNSSMFWQPGGRARPFSGSILTKTLKCSSYMSQWGPSGRSCTQGLRRLYKGSMSEELPWPHLECIMFPSVDLQWYLKGPLLLYSRMCETKGGVPARI